MTADSFILLGKDWTDGNPFPAHILLTQSKTVFSMAFAFIFFLCFSFPKPYTCAEESLGNRRVLAVLTMGGTVLGLGRGEETVTSAEVQCRLPAHSRRVL